MQPDKQRLHFLMHRYSTGEAPAGELREFFDLIRMSEDDDLLRAAMQQVWEETVPSAALPQAAQEAMFRNIVQSPAPRRRTMWLAAAVITGVVLAAGLLYLLQSPAGDAPKLAALDHKAGYTEQVTLPDGTRVTLHKGSVLSYPDAWTGGQRLVTLTGEAYFDVAAHPTQPFVIRSGDLTTTVLGTAFNIKAYPGEDSIVVTVMSGRVQVEDKQQVLGILERDKQIVYNIHTQQVQQEMADVPARMVWLKEGLVYDGTPFGEIARQIAQRYHITIRFANPALKNCPITASFAGTESLEDILTTLCTVRAATYSLENDTAIIHGDGCGF